MCVCVCVAVNAGRQSSRHQLQRTVRSNVENRRDRD